jgi:hypothetical protein
VVGQVEVERVRAVLVRLQVKVAAGAVRLLPGRAVEERDEQVTPIPAIEGVRGQLARVAVDGEAQDPGAMSRPKAAVGRRDLEVGRERAVVGLQAEALEDERLVDREVRQAAEVVALGGRDRAARCAGEELVLVRPELRDRVGIGQDVLVVVVVVVVRVVVMRLVVGHVAILRRRSSRPRCGSTA